MNVAGLISRRDWLAHAAGLGAVLAGAHTWQRRTMAADDSKLRIIDPHVHVWTHDARYPWAADLAEPPKEDALPETLLGLMQAHGVDKTVIVHVIYYRWDCRYAADCVKAHPDKFMGVCRVDPRADNAAAEVERWTAAGFHGVRLSPYAGTASDWIADRPRIDAIWSRAAELKIPVCVLCDTSRLPDVEKVIQRFADRVDVCIDHMSDCPIDRPGELARLTALARYPRVFVKISHLWSLSREAYPYRDTHDQVRRLYDAFGPQRLMWGSDWPAVEPYCGYGRAVSLYRDEIKFFNDEDRRWILGATALRLWPFAPNT
jgi:L-fuconolactonase